MTQNNQSEITALQKHTEEFEWIKRNFDKFKHELELINRQNPYECELYSVIACIIRCCMNEEGVSLRDVSRIQTYHKQHTDHLKSAGGFPDFVFLGNEYDKKVLEGGDMSQKNSVLGAVEIKYMHRKIYNAKKKRINFETQIKSHIERFEKVIYTNGLEWRLYGFDSVNADFPRIFQLGSLKKDTEIEWQTDAEDTWVNLLEYLHGIKWREPLSQ